jgi:arginyl-tRNA synthetase
MKIAVAAIKYSMLKQDSKKNIIFDRNQAISFEGDTGPYLLYSYARASSIGRKVKSKKAVKIVDLKDVEIRLLKKIDSFPDVVAKAYENLAPNLIANYCFELSKLFNEFYHSCPVLGSIEEGFRLKLVEAFRITLGKGMNLLGIEVLEEM